MIDEILKSTRATLYERTSSPLMGAFTISWLIWNHRLILTIFSEMSLDAKFNYIDRILYGTSNELWGILLVGPLVTSLVYIFLYPFPAAFVFEFARSQQRKLREIKQKIEDEELLSVEESRRLRRQHYELQQAADIEVKARDEEISNLKIELDGAEGRVAEAEGDRDKLQEELNELRIRLAEKEKLAVEWKDNMALAELKEKDLANAIVGKLFRFVTNQSTGNEKEFRFLPGGSIGEGKNSNENRWRIKDGKVELLQADGTVHSRFFYDVESRALINQNDEDTPSARNQRMTPISQG